ncbi:recombinase family protein [Petroclostridium sp. X23]|uniref:recombinase family protein n=1 Tax=Petroclostridium sp. X23 TaxID=3045146 RepID=UPI0024AE0F02|nr:recombinase family protein [Petroclostridium sp. X23]WHH59117.1 recombinase family protein [Petroclostridium sp. X23]
MLTSKQKQTAALYVRVSTEEQAKEGYSIGAQIDVLTQYCKLFNIDIFKVYKDLGISGKDTINRDGLNQLVRDSKKGVFNLILVWKISRLSRSLKDILTLVDTFEQHGVSFASYSEKFDTSTPVGRMTLQILGSIAEFERNTIVENVKLGLKEITKQGRKTGGSILGYDPVDKKLVINEKEANIVRLIFDLYVNQKMGLTKIAIYLNENGYKTKRGRPFSKNGVGLILANSTYIGLNRHQIGTENEYTVEGIHSPIIDMELWDKAQAIRESRASIVERRHEAGIFLLSGLLKCPACGCAMTSAYTISTKKLKNTKKTYRYRYYHCNNFDTKRTCKAHWISANKIENQVIEYIENLSKKPNAIKKVIKNTYEKAKKDNTPVEQEIKYLSNEIDKLEKSKEQYFYMLESGKISNPDTFIERINDIDIKLQQLKNSKAQKEIIIDNCADPIDDKQVVNYFKQFSDMMKVATPEDKKALIRLSIKEVFVTDNMQIDGIEFLFPIGKNGIVQRF